MSCSQFLRGTKPEIGTKLGRKCMRQNVRELALDGLIQVEKSGAYSNLLLNNLIEKVQLIEKILVY